MENIATRDVHIKRRASISGTLVQGTPVIVTANGSPTSIFGDRKGYIIKGRFMIVNATTVPLFDLLNIIRLLHELPAFVTSNDDIPDDI